MRLSRASFITLSPAILRHSLDTAATAAQQAHAPGSFTVYTLSGSPADAVITAIEPFDGLVARRGGVPVLVVSGVNVGPNLGTDVLYSGTFSAARQGGLYGVPAVAVSLCGGDGGGGAAAAAAALVVRLLAVAAVGDAVLAAALVAGADGLPAWLAAEADGRGGAPAADEADAMRLEVTRVAGVHVGGSQEAAP
ncbi:hypothetical protein I4F81_002766 [Pyropia yezoensis]|uniref:Uncharacterized protein n=1 Tax=Pyropia yezoensis TaxID=2788 RepID=A0ACC3BQJ8_PYRYE|nr:hypothetical protein I4F81_002766 [Neopyropia yezoensis]